MLIGTVACSAPSYYPYGSSASDSYGPSSDDGSVQINFSPAMWFGSSTYSTLYMSTNGLVSFGGSYSAYDPTFPPSCSIIAPYWADFVLASGSTWYHVYNDVSAVTKSIFQEVRRYWPRAYPPKASMVLTWNTLGFYNCDNRDVATVQMTILWNNHETYVSFRYLNLAIAYENCGNIFEIFVGYYASSTKTKTALKATTSTPIATIRNFFAYAQNLPGSSPGLLFYKVDRRSSLSFSVSRTLVATATAPLTPTHEITLSSTVVASRSPTSSRSHLHTLTGLVTLSKTHHETATLQPTASRSALRSASPSTSASPDFSNSRSSSYTLSVSATKTPLSSVSSTSSPSNLLTQSAHVSPSASLHFSNTHSSSFPTLSARATGTRSSSSSPTSSFTILPTQSSTVLATATRSPQLTTSNTRSVSPSRSASISPSMSASKSVSRSTSRSASTSLTPTAVIEPTPTPSFTRSLSAPPVPTASWSISTSPTGSETPTVTHSPTPSPTTTASFSTTHQRSYSWSGSPHTQSLRLSHTASLNVPLTVSPSSSATQSPSPTSSPTVTYTAPTPSARSWTHQLSNSRSSSGPTPSSTHSASSTSSASLSISSSLTRSTEPTATHTATPSRSYSHSTSNTLSNPNPTVTSSEAASVSRTVSRTSTASASFTPLDSATATLSTSGAASTSVSATASAATPSATGSLQHVYITLSGHLDDIPVASLIDDPTGTSLFIELHGDKFVPRCDPCALYNGSGPGMQSYTARSRVVLKVLNSSFAQIVLMQDVTARVDPAESIFVTLQACCLGYNLPVPSGAINITVLPLPKRDSVVSQGAVDVSKGAGAGASVVGGVLGSPGVATQASRTALVFEMEECSPDWDGLDFISSPTGIAIGSEDVAYHLGAAIMNPLLIALLAGMQLGGAWWRARRVHGTLLDGIIWIRFPSLLAFPIMLLLEATTSSAMIVMIYGSTGGRIASCLSLMISVAVPVAAGFHLRHIRNHAHCVACEPKSIFVKFIDGMTKWRDTSESRYCRRNRLLFCDYNERNCWFITIEMSMCVMCGLLGGIKLGFGRCNGVIIVLFVVLLVYIATLVIRRPYTSPLIFTFGAITTALQLFSVVMMMLHKFGDVSGALSAADVGSVIAMYVLLVQTIVGIYPRLRSTAKGGDEVRARARALQRLPSP